MGCERFEEALWEAAEGEPSPVLAEHLGKCPACRQARESLKAAYVGLSALRTVSAPEVQAVVPARSRRRLLVPAVIGATAVCATLGVALLSTLNRPRPLPPAKVRPPVGTAVAAVKNERSEVRAAQEPSRPKRDVRPAYRGERKRVQHRARPTRVPEPNPVSDSREVSTQPVVMDPARVRPTQQYTIMIPGRTDPVKQYTVMIPGRTDPVRENTVVLDPTYRRMPQREVIVLSDAEQVPWAQQIGEN
jgi:hypothetical protein